jgi:hypothetical protein
MTTPVPLTGKPAPERVPIHGQIAELRREMALRHSAYPRWVREGRMKQSEADLCLARLDAALATLMWVSANRDLILMVRRQVGEQPEAGI